MLALTPHTTSRDAVTLLSYDADAHHIIVKQLSSDCNTPAEEERHTLVQFLRAVGIPFNAVRAVTAEG